MKSSVKYSRLPRADWVSMSHDQVAIDFSSPFNFESVFTYSKAVPPYVAEERSYDPPIFTRICSSVVVALSCFFVFLTFPITCFVAVKRLQQFERLVVFRLGRLQPPKGPGIVLVLPFIDKWRRVDMRTRAFNVPPQQLITADGAAISVGATIYSRTTDVALSIASVQDLNHSTRMLAQTILLGILSSRSLKVIENEKAYIHELMQNEMNETTNKWGVEVSRVELSQVTVVQEAVAGVSIDKLGSIFSQLVSGQTSPMTNLLGTGPVSQIAPTLLAPSLPHHATHVPSSKPPTTSPRELISSVRPLLTKSLVDEVGAVYKFVVTGEDGGTFFLDLKSGFGDAGTGEPLLPPDVTLTMATSDLHAMFTGEVRPYMAFMTGRLQVEGDRSVAMKLDAVMQKLQNSSC
ncbi:stomatin-like protein 1 [Asterias rubens]|uniref:stomatin-like protein 1 n=1 Tax=Asterias rubens TaxID=7604 RepID=UPI001455749D|nr:stomatin-like protein 1 [Asterias rubens]